MILYTCGQKTTGRASPIPAPRPARRSTRPATSTRSRPSAATGSRLWTWGSRDADREEVKRLSGTNEVPILVLDDGEVISGSGTIAKWAKEHPHSPAKSGS